MSSNDVLIRLVADVSGLNKELTSVKKQLEKVEDSTSQASSKLSDSFKKVGTVIAGAFAVDKIKDFTKSMIEASASVNALDSMFEQTFKGEQAQALELISKQAQAQGIHVDRLKGTWASFYGTFRGNGADANESLQLTSRYMELAGDASAYYDLTLEDVVSRLKSITMGNFEAGDAIGININATKMDTIAKEKLNKAWQNLNDTEKEFLLIDTAEQIYENSGAMGQGSREADNWSNVLANLQTVWERLMGTLGQPVLKTAVGIVQNLTSKLEVAVNWVSEFKTCFDEAYSSTGKFSDALSNALDKMGMDWASDFVQGVQSVIDGIKEMVNWFKEHETITLILASSLGILTAGIISFNVWLKAGAISMKAMSIATGLWNTVTTIGTTITTAFGVAMAFLTSPIGIVTAAIMGLVAVGILLYKNWDSVKAFLSKCWEGIKSTAVQVWESIKSFFTATWEGIKSVTSTVWEGIKTFFVTIWTNISNFFTTCLEGIKSFFSTIWEGIKTVITTVMTAIFTVITTVWNSIYQFIAPILQLIQIIVLAVWQGIQLALAVILTAITFVIKTAWEGIKAVVETIVNVIKTIIETVWNVIKTVTTTIFDAIKLYFTTVFNAYKKIITTVIEFIKPYIEKAWNTIKEVTSTVFNAIKTFFTNVWNGIKSVVTTVVNGISSVISTVWNTIKTVTSNVFNSVKSTVSSIWNGIKSVVSSVVDGIWSAVSSAFNRVSSTTTSVFNGLKSTVSSIWNGIGRGIQSCVNGIISVINGMVRAMNKISFDVPSWVPGMGGKKFGFNLPTISPVSWFATGGIIKGTHEGTIVGVGENGGDEAILPLSNKGRMKPFAKAVANFMPDNTGSNSDSTITQTFNLNGMVVREDADIQKIAQELYKLQERNRRKRGVVYA